MPQVRFPYAEYAHEFSFSLNIALCAKFAASSSFRWNWELGYWDTINRYLHLHPHNSTGYWIAFFFFAFVAALFLFFLLRISSYARLTQELLGTVAGIASISAMPASWLYARHLSPQLPGLPNPPRSLLLLEVGVILVFTFLLLFWWHRTPAQSISVLLVHLCFWTWLFVGGWRFWRDPFKVVFPFVGFLSSVTWIVYLSERKIQEEAASTV